MKHQLNELRRCLPAGPLYLLETPYCNAPRGSADRDPLTPLVMLSYFAPLHCWPRLLAPSVHPDEFVSYVGFGGDALPEKQSVSLALVSVRSTRHLQLHLSV